MEILTNSIGRCVNLCADMMHCRFPLTRRRWAPDKAKAHIPGGGKEVEFICLTGGREPCSGFREREVING